MARASHMTRAGHKNYSTQCGENKNNCYDSGAVTLNSARAKWSRRPLEGRRRNDLRVHGSATTRRTTIDYVKKVGSLVLHNAPSTTTRVSTGTSRFKHVQFQAESVCRKGRQSG